MDNNTAKRWAVLSLGYFSRNRYWGEDEANSYRSALCTSVFVEIGGKRLVIDPPVSGKAMDEMLDQRTGLKPGDIDCVFITHSHFDHFVGLGSFPNAELLCAPGDYESIRLTLTEPSDENITKQLPERLSLAERLRPAGAQIIPGVELIELPGHTLGLAGALFTAAEGKVLVAGDSVMTADHFKNRQGYYNSADFEKSSVSIDKMAAIADIVVPGHSNYFIVGKL
ncbi:MAG: MBL fold metallo-hydrolase [Oscillospiraceae bacterium]|nr:MBL fold metallo-hydrolase [Oscillospiraceae bacterium]